MVRQKNGEILMPKTEAFEKYSDAYDDWFKKNAKLYEAELKAIRQVLPPPGAEGMEVGIGSGKFAVPLGIQTGVEPSEKMAEKARMQGLKVYPGVAEALPFPENRFDFVLMVTTICFVDDAAQSFREAFRVIKPKGCVMVGFVDKNSELGRRYAKNSAKSRFYKDAVFFSAPEIMAGLKEAGFEIATIRQALIPGQTSETIEEGFGKGAFVVIKAVK